MQVAAQFVTIGSGDVGGNPVKDGTGSDTSDQ